MDPSLADSSRGTKAKNLKKAAISKEYGPKPYDCDYCNKRFGDLNAMRTHSTYMHLDWEWEQMSPALDPNYKKSSGNETVNTAGTDTQAIGSNEEGSQHSTVQAVAAVGS
jgi:beta-galactosidase GanA